MNHVIFAKRSAGGSYQVEFLKDANWVRVRCNCSAGSIGQICRHKRALIAGNPRMLHDPSQGKLLDEILSWTQMKLLAERAAKYEEELEAIDRKKNEIENEEQLIRRRYASDCLDGIHGT